LAVQHFNSQIIDAPDLGKGKQIGHSFFFDVTDPASVRDLWRFELLPLIEEYFFGQFDRIQQTLFAGNGELLLDYDRQEIKQFYDTQLAEALSALLTATERTET
jgi:5-methylcytosine-specific restriction protein B